MMVYRQCYACSDVTANPRVVRMAALKKQSSRLNARLSVAVAFEAKKAKRITLPCPKDSNRPNGDDARLRRLLTTRFVWHPFMRCSKGRNARLLMHRRTARSGIGPPAHWMDAQKGCKSIFRRRLLSQAGEHDDQPTCCERWVMGWISMPRDGHPPPPPPQGEGRNKPPPPLMRNALRSLLANHRLH